MNRNRLNKERKKIDKIDQQLFKLIKKRTIVVKKMLTFKKFKSEIVDHKRINEILLKLKEGHLLNFFFRRLRFPVNFHCLDTRT